MAKTGFENELELKKGRKIKNPWGFDAPEYDQRSSCFINAGTHHGVGHKQPIGHKGNSKTSSPLLPMGRHTTMKVDDKSFFNESTELYE